MQNLANMQIAETGLETDVEWSDIFADDYTKTLTLVCSDMPHIQPSARCSGDTTEIVVIQEIPTLEYADCEMAHYLGDDDVTEAEHEYAWLGPDAVVTRDRDGNITVVPVER